MEKEFIESFNNWAKINFLKISFKSDNIIQVAGFEGDFLLIEPKDDALIDEDCCLILYEEELELIEENKVQYLLFEFGKRFYYTKPITFKNKFNQVGYEAHFDDFKYIGENNCELDNIIPFIHLGVHDEYELLNGSQMAKDWVKKAKFLKHKALGLADKNTLGGTLAFQTEIKKAGLKSVLGVTISVADNYNKEKDVQVTYDLKVYVTNESAWQNLFQISKAINVDYDKFIPEKVLFKYAKGLIAVFPSNSVLGDLEDIKTVNSIIKKYKLFFDDVYYQIDSVEYDADNADLKYLKQIKKYLNNYREVIKPILINDSYYMDQEMFQLKEYLNKVDRKAYEYSEDQYFKTLDEVNQKFSPLFKDNDEWLELLLEMCNNTVELAEKCQFEISVGESKLPKYEFSPDGLSNEDYFFQLIEKAFEEKVINKGLDQELYMKRIQTECEVIVPAGFVDYFLILYDIINWCKENNIEVGPGRGSVGGSLVAQFLNITSVDPIRHDLLFERFLNPTRVLPETFYKVEFKDGEEKKIKEGDKIIINEQEIPIEQLKIGGKIKQIKIVKEARKDSMPDIDCDFQSEFRNDVKKYISMHFGESYTCSVGAYGRLKLKAGLKDFGRAKGLDFNYVNTITKDIKQKLSYSWRDFIMFAIGSKIKQQNKEEKIGLYDFVQKYPEICHCIKYSLNQARSASIHASAVVIVPKNNKKGESVDIFNWLPIREIDGNLVTEWEGLYCDKAGFLKEDILALRQLDKFQMIKKLIKRNKDIEIILEEIPLDDKPTFQLFKKGLNEDVFQFSSSGLKNYSVQVKPDTLEELTAMNALYRPGPMSSNAHTDFGLIKHGKKKPEYDYGLKEVTEKTYGLYVYQEQIMKSVVVLGGFSLAESETTRTKIKKFDKVGMSEDKQKFIEGAIKRGCKEEEAGKIWDKLVAFSGYGFNKCMDKNTLVKTTYGDKTIFELFKDQNNGIKNILYSKLGNKLIEQSSKEIIKSGKKELFKIELENGEFISFTKEHRLLTNRGWKTLKDINLKDKLISVIKVV